MLVARRLAGLSALEAHYAGVGGRLQSERRSSPPGLHAICHCGEAPRFPGNFALRARRHKAQRSDTGKVFVWLDRRAMDRVNGERRRGEDLSDTMVRLATLER
jgi:hypothetical protein